MIKKGNVKIERVYKGSTEITKIYQGINNIFNKPSLSVESK